MNRSTALVVAAFSVYGLLVEAQQQSPRAPSTPVAPPADSRPTFRGGVELVQLDVSVLDERRRPVTGLSAADFTVTENGKSRPIASFAAIELPGPSAAPAAWTRDVARDVASNAPLDGGRLVVILLDRTVPVGQPTITARSIARAAIEELGPNDQAAVIFTGFGTPQNFTSDRARLLAAIERADSSTEPSSDAAEGVTGDAFGGLQPGQCYCGICVPETIAHVAETVRDIPRRKSLLFIGSSVAFQSTEIDCAFRLRDATNRMMQALDLANVTIHSFDPVGLENATSLGRASSPLTGRGAFIRAPSQIVAQQAGQNSLRVLPDRTGGRVVANTNAPQTAVKAVMDESRAYYLLAFESDEPQRGKARDIRVRTSRRGARVYAQRRYQPEAPGPVEERGSEVARSLARATAGTSPTSDVPLTLSLVPLAAAGEIGAEVLVIVGVQYPLSPRGATPASPGAPTSVAAVVSGEDVREELSLLATAYDRFARPRGVDERSFTFSRPVSASGAAPFDAFARLPLRPGSYEVRIAATTAPGATSGSVFSYVDVPNFRSAPLSVSGLMLSDPAAVAATADVVADHMPITPTARRSFSPADRIEAFARVYQGGNRPVASVDVQLTMTTATGLVALDRRLTLEVARFASNRSADLRSELPLALLPPGEHLLSLDLQQGPHRVSRHVRFAIAGPRAR